jgi:hypothetical protein
MKERSTFHCSTISNIMTCKRFMFLNRCLYITNPVQYVSEKGLPNYDKLRQTWWLVNAIWDNCKNV